MGKIGFLKNGYSMLRNNVTKIKINPKTLGYICPDGIINFQTKEVANNYAKNRAISALKGYKPHERFIVVDQNRILDEIEGHSTMGFIFPNKYKTKGISIVHGHPDSYAKGCTTPVSASDASTILRWGNLNEIIAYNSKGEFSILRKKQTTTYNWLNNIRNKFQRFVEMKNSEAVKNDYKRYITSSDISKQLKEINKKITKCIKGNVTEEEFEILINKKNKLSKLFEEIQTNQLGCQKTHKFWLERAKKYNLEYTTNYSNL